jgi:hypothetical protein
MATEKILNTRIQLKYDSLQNWATANTLLKAGEVAVAYLPPKGTGEAPAAVSEAVLMKVGPGNFNDLPFVSAPAADVYAWAKKTEAEFTAWIGTLPNTITLSVGGENKKYSIEDAIKLVRSEIEAGGEAAAIRVENTSELAPDGSGTSFSYTVYQGEAAIADTIEVAVGAGLGVIVTNGDDGPIDPDVPVIVLSDETQASLEKADTAVQTVELYQLDPINNGVTLQISVDGDTTKNRTDISGTEFVKITASGTEKTNTAGDSGNITIGIDSTKFETAVKAIEVDKAVEAGKTTKALTVKVGGADVVFDGSAAKTANVDSAISAAIGDRTTYTNDEIDDLV